MCGSVRVGEKPKECVVERSDDIKAAFKRKEAAWKVLRARDEDAKERCMEIYREEEG